MPTSLWTAWHATVDRAPDADALIDAQQGNRFSRADLSQTALALSTSAPPQTRPGQIVAFALPNGPQWLARFLMVQRLDLVALPLDPSLPTAQQGSVAATLGAHWFIEENAPQWRRLATAAEPLQGDHCLVKSTSGSTGQPRALAFTSANMLADGRQIAATMGVRPDDRNLGAIPFGHSYGLGNLVLPLIIQGTALISSREILPEWLARQTEDFGATVLPSVPAVLRALAAASGDPARLRTLRTVLSAGAPLRPEVARAFHEKFGLPIHNFYGSSETGGICYDRTGEATLTGRSVGEPLEGVEVSLDNEGRITVRSDAVIAPGAYTLGDLGAWNERGELSLTGRALPLANLGGKKVSPLEIERALRALDGVSDAWVGVQSRENGGGDFLLAAVETGRSSSEVRHALAERLPSWQVPRRLWTAAQLPRTARGKLDRAELEARCLGVEPA